MLQFHGLRVRASIVNHASDESYSTASFAQGLSFLWLDVASMLPILAKLLLGARSDGQAVLPNLAKLPSGARSDGQAALPNLAKLRLGARSGGQAAPSSDLQDQSEFSECKFKQVRVLLVMNLTKSFLMFLCIVDYGFSEDSVWYRMLSSPRTCY